jgi:hypothetical protein
VALAFSACGRGGRGFGIAISIFDICLGSATCGLAVGLCFGS